VAIVRKINENDIRAPLVEVVSEQRVHIDLSKEKDPKIKRSLNPMSEGKEYIELL
jgi:hypothetical protein